MADDDLESTIEGIIDSEVFILKKELGKEYSRTLGEMNSRGILFSGITINNVKNNLNGIIEKNVSALIKKLKDFNFLINGRFRSIIENKVQKEIEKLEKDYGEQLKKLVPDFSATNLFQDSKIKLHLLLKDYMHE